MEVFGATLYYYHACLSHSPHFWLYSTRLRNLNSAYRLGSSGLYYISLDFYFNCMLFGFILAPDMINSGNTIVNSQGVFLTALLRISLPISPKRLRFYKYVCGTFLERFSDDILLEIFVKSSMFSQVMT